MKVNYAAWCEAVVLVPVSFSVSFLIVKLAFLGPSGRPHTLHIFPSLMPGDFLFIFQNLVQVVTSSVKFAQVCSLLGSNCTQWPASVCKHTFTAFTRHVVTLCWFVFVSLGSTMSLDTCNSVNNDLELVWIWNEY